MFSLKCQPLDFTGIDLVACTTALSVKKEILVYGNKKLGLHPWGSLTENRTGQQVRTNIDKYN